MHQASRRFMTEEADIKGIRMHGAGNRVLLVDRASLGSMEGPELARGTSAPIDALLVLDDRGEEGIGVRVYNRDGSDGSVCGNGMRCVAAISAPHGGEVTLISDEGPHRARVEATGDGNWLVALDMPEAQLGAATVGLAQQADEDGLIRVDLGTGELELYPVSTGNPHLICLVNEAPSAELVNTVGPAAQQLREGGINLHLVKLLSRASIALLPIERGVGPTAACATGAQAAVAALHAQDLCDVDVDVHMPGGTLRVQLGSPTHVTGPAAIDRSPLHSP
ncbi:MAG: diaminopimelate epimerase [Phycisphaerales bacterium]|nr:diaminopimelate epimerase [Phycisphaerales bacterium]